MPKPRSDETRADFLARCMGHKESRADFPSRDQRFSFCYAQWDKQEDLGSEDIRKRVNTRRLNQDNRRLDRRSRGGFARAIQAWMDKYVRFEISQIKPGNLPTIEPAPDDKASKSRIIKVDLSDLSSELQELITRFGLAAAKDGANRSLASLDDTENMIRGTLTRDAIENRDVVLGHVQLFLQGLDSSVNEIMATNKKAVEDAIKQVMLEAYDEGITDTRTLALRIKDRVKTMTEFSFERSYTIARTETLMASSAGSVDGYKITGVKQMEWLAYSSPRWPRRHDRMNGQKRPIDEPFYNETTGERMMFPGDMSRGAPIGEVINCRCSVAPLMD